MKMRIWIDIGHIPQHNFYMPFIRLLSAKGHTIYVTVLRRGKLPKIVENDLKDIPNISISTIGAHRMTKWSAIIDVNIVRMPLMLKWAIGKKIDVAFSNHHQVPIIAKILRIPSYTFSDDPDTKIFPIALKFATKCFSLVYEMPEGRTLDKRDKLLPCLKEWAYLNPRTFVPRVDVLEKYGVKPKEYMFLREVSVGTINYTGQASGAILGIKDMIPKGMKVLFSLEEKKRRNDYPAEWILLQEPIEDIHSLIYYSAGLVSSGDSMAREAALLGVPAYYLGIRYSMPANAAAAKVASLQNQKTMAFDKWIGNIRKESQESRVKRQEELRTHIDKEFIDINEYMLNLIEQNQ